MTEILTESFCERCGTRYTFETAAPRRSRIGRVRVATRGLRNYVMQDESSFSEAMADARSDEERSATTHQLDAFHKTFNFCMTCRQYTCGNCWNTDEGRCLTCAPLPEVEPPAADLAEVVVAEAPEATEPHVDAAEPHGDAAEDEAWPEADLAPDRLARAMGLAGAAADTEAAAGEPPAADTAVADVPHVRGLAPGESLEDALAAYEAQIAAQEEAALETTAGAEPLTEESGPMAPAPAVEPGPEVEPPLAVEPEVVAEAEPEVEEVAAEAEPEVEEVAAEAEEVVPEPVAGVEPEIAVEPEIEPVTAAARDDVVLQPTWPVPTGALETSSVPQPDAEPTAPSNPWLTVAPDDGSTAPQWPIAPHWTRSGTSRELPTTLAGRPIVPQDNAAALWAASAREVLAGGSNPVTPAAAVPATPQPCVSCGLSLSPNARFCRRCGTRQA